LVNSINVYAGLFRRKEESDPNLSAAAAAAASSEQQGSKQVSMKLMRVGTQTMANLLQHCKENRRRFAAAGVAEVLINVVSESRYLGATNTISIKIDREMKIIEYLDSSIIECCLLALHSLASEQAGKERLSSMALFTAKTLMNAVAVKEDGTALVSFLIASIITRLCDDGCETCQTPLGDTGAVEWLICLLYRLCAHWGHSSTESRSAQVSNGATVSISSAARPGRKSVISTMTSVLGGKTESGTEEAGAPASAVKPKRQSILETLTSVIRTGTSDSESSSMLSRSTQPFAASFTIDSSRALAEEACKALLALVTSNGVSQREVGALPSEDAAVRLHALNLMRAKAAIVETSVNPVVNGIAVLHGGRDVLSTVIARFSVDSGLDRSAFQETVRLATSVLEVVKPPVPLLVAQMKGAGSIGMPLMPHSPQQKSVVQIQVRSPPQPSQPSSSCIDEAPSSSDSIDQTTVVGSQDDTAVEVDEC